MRFRFPEAMPMRASAALSGLSIRCRMPPGDPINPEGTRHAGADPTGKIQSPRRNKTRIGRIVVRSTPNLAQREIMTDRLQYGTTAKIFHWLVLALLLVQYPIGWLMPDIHRGMTPGVAMTFHTSIGLVILAAVVLRLSWR